jgi:hypothetical protein
MKNVIRKQPEYSFFSEERKKLQQTRYDVNLGRIGFAAHQEISVNRSS